MLLFINGDYISEPEGRLCGSLEGSPGRGVADDVRAARDRLDAQLQAVMTAMRARDNAAAEQRLQDADQTVVVIERFLAK